MHELADDVMKRATVVALLLWTSALLAVLGPAIAADGGKASQEADGDDESESDSAPFMVVVEHSNGRRCAGSLVSLRTALTSAWCVRGSYGGNPRELWALSPSMATIPTPSRRVARVALVAGADVDSPSPHLEPGWLGAALDIAVLELEAPFGGGARSRPILMATRREDCAASKVCHVVRVRGRPPRLRILDADVAPGETCSAIAQGWPAIRDSAICLTGPTLCAMDRGAGVVCDGKLCGVLSRSARSAGDASAQNKTVNATSPADKHDATCGDVHVALSVARMRRFLHCAHTLRACGRGGECSNQCSERQLMVLEEGNDNEIPGAGSDISPEHMYTRTTESYVMSADTSTEHLLTPSHTQRDLISYTDSEASSFTQALSTVGKFIPIYRTEEEPPTRTVSPATLTSQQTMATMTVHVTTPRPAFEFEPNRADFRGAPARTSRVYLKAGEYGDNAVDYGDSEEGAMGGGLPTTTAASLSSVPGALTTVFMNSSINGTSVGELIQPPQTGNTSTEHQNITGVKTRKSNYEDSKIPYLRVSKLDAQLAAENEKPGKRSLGVSTTKPRAIMSFVFITIILFLVN